MYKVTLIIIALFIFVGCSSKNKKEPSPSPYKWEHYSGAWFDFDYPSFMQIEELRNEITDTYPSLKEGGDVFVYSEYLPFCFKFTKSCMVDVFDRPEKWRDFSIETKLGDLSDETENYIGIYGEKDSIDFKGNPAASVTFAMLEDNDTIVHQQLVVMKMPSKELYYLNIIIKDAFNNYDNIVDSVLNSIVLK